MLSDPRPPAIKKTMLLILAATIPILWFAMQFDDTVLGRPVIVCIIISGLVYCWIGRRPEGGRADRHQVRRHERRK